MPHPHTVLALSGGVGGAKLALGLSRCLPAEQLVIAANTGDDFEHLGLHIAPDLDSVFYALAGLSDEERGWGVADESWHCLQQLQQLGAETWFQLGDRDLALHLQRSALLRAGYSLSEATAVLLQALGLPSRLWPMSNDPVRTQVQTDQGELPFQHYFVREQCRPAVRGFHFAGAETARPLPELLRLLSDARLRAVVICPSNPFVSIGPMLALPALDAALRATSAPVVAVSPIVGGRALKGPAAKMLQDLQMPVSPLAIARYYSERLSGLVIDEEDAALAPAIEAEGLAVAVLPTVMRSLADRERLAREVLAFVDGLCR